MERASTKVPGVTSRNRNWPGQAVTARDQLASARSYHGAPQGPDRAGKQVTYTTAIAGSELKLMQYQVERATQKNQT